jgi:hypothetical protein
MSVWLLDRFSGTLMSARAPKSGYRFEALEPIRNWLLHGYRTLDQVRESQGIT